MFLCYPYFFCCCCTFRIREVTHHIFCKWTISVGVLPHVYYQQVFICLAGHDLRIHRMKKNSFKSYTEIASCSWSCLLIKFLYIYIYIKLRVLYIQFEAPCWPFKWNLPLHIFLSWRRKKKLNLCLFLLCPHYFCHPPTPQCCHTSDGSVHPWPGQPPHSVPATRDVCVRLRHANAPECVNHIVVSQHSTHRWRCYSSSLLSCSHMCGRDLP